ncbi:HlyD family secretion protein [Cupriavidus basilensis]
MTHRTRLSLFLAVIVVAVLLLAGYKWWRHTQSDALPQGISQANGRLELTRVDVAAKYPGRLMSLSFQEGDQVQAGAVLGLQDDSELQAKLAQSQATLARAQSEQARARAEQAAQKRKVSLARLEWEQAQTLLSQKEISSVELARRRLALEAEIEAQNAADNAIGTAGHAVGEAQAQIELVQAMLDGLQLRAPIAGRIEYRVVEPGTVLLPGGRIATLLDTSDAYLTVFYPADVAARLKIGDDARIVLEGYDGLALPATVSMIDTNAQFTPKYVETTRERQNLVYRVKLRIPREVSGDLQGRLKAGITGDGYVRTSDQSWPPTLQTKAAPKS